jgi:hypothetical protein
MTYTASPGDQTLTFIMSLEATKSPLLLDDAGSLFFLFSSHPLENHVAHAIYQKYPLIY